MEIILTQNDIESLIKKAYSGINNVRFNTKSLKVSLDIDIAKFSLFKQVAEASSIPGKTINLSPDEKFREEIKQGTMGSGGIRRVLQKMG